MSLRAFTAADLRRGALAGLAGGTAMAAVLLVAGEGPIQRAIDLEAGGGDEFFSRGSQRAGGVAAALLVGLAVGTVFAVALAAIRRRSAHVDGWRAAVWLGAAAFTALNLVPALKYPPNPPGVGDPDTVTRRTLLYLLMLAWSLLVSWAGVRAWRWLKARGTAGHIAGPAVAGLVVGLAAIAMVALPPGPDTGSLPANLVWQLRLASLGGWAAYWAVTAVVLGWLTLGAGHAAVLQNHREGQTAAAAPGPGPGPGRMWRRER